MTNGQSAVARCGSSNLKQPEIEPEKHGEAWNRNGLDYVRRLFENVMGWYRNADTKAQILLTLDGAFLAFLGNSVFRSRDDITKIVSAFAPVTWIMLALTFVALVASVFCALACLWSRLSVLQRTKARILVSARLNPADAATYTPVAMWFFQMVGWLEPENFHQRLRVMDEELELKVLAHEVVLLSRNVSEKHIWVNFGFLFAACSLVSFVVAGATYAIVARG